MIHDAGATLEEPTPGRAGRAAARKFSAEAFRCRLCGDVIGVYEPLVECVNSHLRATSRAAEPDLNGNGVYYHRLCFEERHGDPSPTG